MKEIIALHKNQAADVGRPAGDGSPARSGRAAGGIAPSVGDAGTGIQTPPLLSLHASAMRPTVHKWPRSFRVSLIPILRKAYQ